MSNTVVVIGSMNMDMVIRTSHIPKPGETVLGDDFFMNPGGKGANQAIAIARLGMSVAFVGKIGNDIFGKQASQLFEEEGIDKNNLIEDDDNISGIALITVDEKGENSIVVAPGANWNLSEEDISSVFVKNKDARILLMQLEIPLKTVEFAAQKAKMSSMYVVVNPAPADPSMSTFYHLIDILTPNISEAEILAGITISTLEDVKLAAKIIVSQGVENVVITLGKDGALLLENGAFSHIEAPCVEVIDTTAAGDAFNGALVVGIAEGKSLKDAVKFACLSAAISVTKLGAQSSIPFRNEVLLNLI